MLTKLIRAIFVPKRVRTKLAQAQRAAPKSRPAGTKISGGPGARDKLLGDTMALYRRQRQDVYESLDADTKRRIEDDAEKAFGKVLRAKD